MKLQTRHPHEKLNAANKAGQPVRWIRQYIYEFWPATIWHKALVVLVLLVSLTIGSMYGIARWYIWQERNKPLELGASFVSGYASALGLDPRQTFTAMLDDLGVKHVRLMSHWDDIEPQAGTYNFSELDWEFQQANVHHATVSLAI